MNVFSHNGKRTAIVSFAHHTANINHFPLNLPLILERRLSQRESVDFREIYTFQPAISLFAIPIDFDIVIFAQHLSENPDCTKFHKMLYDYFSSNTVAVFTEINKLIEQYPSSLKDTSEQKTELFFNSNTPTISPDPDPFPSAILPNLYVGPVYFSTNNTFLDEKNIGAIVSVMVEPHPLAGQASFMRLHHIPIQDKPNVNILEYIDECNDFIQKCLESGINVYVHCGMGISRSVSFVIAFLMKTKKMSYNNALEFVRQRRSQAEPNFGFCCQLMTYEKNLNTR
jgi:hypothetical protein